MCRWLAYMGPPIRPEAFLFHPQNSLIQQSLSARLSHIVTNGDGFGLGWYAGREEPGLFRDVLPAWNDDNLKSVAGQIETALFFAHVRAATAGGISRANCHPFRFGRWLFMHNGQIGGYAQIRRRLDAMIAPQFYAFRQGATDSEAFFMILLSNGLMEDPEGAFARAVGQVEAAMAEEGIDAPFKITAAASDGVRIFALRHSTDGLPPSLYVGAGAAPGSILVGSEPLDAELAAWQEIAAGRLVTVAKGCAVDRTFVPVAAEPVAA